MMEQNVSSICYLDSYEFQQLHSEAILVHGVVTDQDGIKFQHAWCEFGDLVHTTDHEFPIDKSLFYIVGKIDKPDKYTFMESIQKSIEFGTYGPWTT